eukprot:CAMPEP_0172192910 /NCGR_PEP_ID=MMETSP1050-20130122/24629_1 /TAXON_ID=233186 /ORGANISM="Cryptomonas curvata, Strain CCAP979/52" /LENGTH=125 /DNA_ID=CAMNT_0012868343 /DNA_START=182 /DNA_END=556 /DNA_ORIENTATION=+
MDGAGGFKSKEEGFGDGDDDDMPGQAPNSKGRRRNVERHLAAERERRKHVKGKLQELDNLLPESTSGPRTLNQTLQAAIAHVKRLLSSGSRRLPGGGANPALPHLDVGPLVKALADSEHTGVAIL